VNKLMVSSSSISNNQCSQGFMSQSPNFTHDTAYLRVDSTGRTGVTVRMKLSARGIGLSFVLGSDRTRFLGFA